MGLKKRRDFFDEKYETSRFDDMIALDEGSNYHDGILRDLLEEDKRKLDEEKRRRELEEQERQRMIQDEYEDMENQDDEWWKKDNDRNKMDQDDEKPIPKILKNKHKSEEEIEDPDKFKFNNPFVYNQGDADMEKHIKPLLS